MSEFIFNEIGIIESPYRQKFAIPRQPGLVPAAKGRIKLSEHCNNLNTLKGIESSSHLWLIFVFHETMDQGWKPMVRPPRLGGNEKMGVFATRTTFRPNPIGMSVVRNEGVYREGKQIYLQISALDLLNGTPILDIKPYLPYSDALMDATTDFTKPSGSDLMTVEFTPLAQQQIQHFNSQYPELLSFIEQVLQQDPRPAYKKNKPDEKTYAMSLYDLNISWRVIANTNQVLEIATTTSP
ncbi:tRNA (N6-threonylcarbamoyladenosine(37)-N6)-methyltransferase TrmO [Motilimonas cestriensis]|uniref:tRNA (N6-threonylcarbamoyladenosine(37)-N6)-methyltransferase TrmO n=1 Tax=Motilimonas cestriensis TaxID=2742685 RepID=A0ABS8W8J0_9GAMM|nr:tRNA (N6-threonylcarbamoyladenosine(37)-N6)-methyltransferase TrmO [Motilimonas cestriensis]MCE2594585.1 tRNA (N6-threonylcarbamoyladenosine(37)-N6)-methyltransferase TrmO [Motilimonas cestriensis]